MKALSKKQEIIAEKARERVKDKPLFDRLCYDIVLMKDSEISKRGHDECVTEVLNLFEFVQTLIKSTKEES